MKLTSKQGCYAQSLTLKSDTHVLTGMEPPSRSTTYRKKKQEITSKKQALPPFSLFAKEILLKCYIDQEVLATNQAYAIKAHFEDAQG